MSKLFHNVKQLLSSLKLYKQLMCSTVQPEHTASQLIDRTASSRENVQNINPLSCISSKLLHAPISRHCFIFREHDYFHCFYVKMYNY